MEAFGTALPAALHDGGGGPSSAAGTGWRGRLSLDYTREGGRTIGLDAHEGPLRVMRSLYPEGDAICHHVLVHPPGGIVGGDTLELVVALDRDAHALVTTPGATRFYRSAGPVAMQRITARVAGGARLEWLPMETLVHPGARASNGMRFDLEPGATMIGWDIVCFGLPARGEPFDRGRFGQRIEIPGAWLERCIVDGEDSRSRRRMASPLGLAGRCTTALVWAATGSQWESSVRDRLLEAAREALGSAGLAQTAGATAPAAGLVVVRALADRVEPLWTAVRAVRAEWRSTLWSLDAAPPRVWST